MLTFITGGARSGKSSYAEQLAMERKQDGRFIHYIATSASDDEEMKERIFLHQKRRNEQSLAYITYEQQAHIEQLLQFFSSDDVVLIDCLTTLVNNELFFDFSSFRSESFRQSLLERLVETFQTFKKMGTNTIVVTNELFYDALSFDEATFTYLRFLGKLHARLVEISTEAIVIESGVAIVMKRQEEK